MLLDGFGWLFTARCVWGKSIYVLRSRTVYGPHKEDRAVFVNPPFLNVPTIRVMTGRKSMLYLKTLLKMSTYISGQDILHLNFHLVFIHMYHRQSDEVYGPKCRKKAWFNSSSVEDSLLALGKLLYFSETQ